VKSRRSLVVSNAGPLIHLAKVNLLHLLKILYGEVVVPSEVKLEAVDRGKEKGFPDAMRIEKAIQEGWMRIEEVKPNRNFADTAKVAGLQDTEVAVVYHAYRNRALALLDDDSARIFARTLGITVRGSLGIVLQARKERQISRDDAAEALDKLAEIMHLAPDVYTLVRKEIEKAD